MRIILWSTRMYIIFWLCLGIASLFFGAIEGLDTGNPLYTTGQTWLGIAVTIGYTYFGLSGKDEMKEDAKKKINKRNMNNVNIAIGSEDGTAEENGGDEENQK